MKSIKAIRALNRFLIALIFIPGISSGQGDQDFGTSQPGQYEIDNERLKEIREISENKKKLNDF